MNLLVMTGRLVADVTTRTTATGTKVSNYRLAVPRRFKREGDPDADFFNCTVFGKSAEFAEKYLHKGSRIVIHGELRNDNYTNREGQMVYRDSIIVNNQEFADSKPTSGDGTTATPPAQNASAITTDADGFMNIPDGIDEELPFQ